MTKDVETTGSRSGDRELLAYRRAGVEAMLIMRKAAAEEVARVEITIAALSSLENLPQDLPPFMRKTALKTAAIVLARAWKES